MTISNIDLAEALENANANGEGMWDLAVEFEEDDGYTKIWLIDYNEFLTSDNFMEDWIWRGAIYPIEEAVKEQSGNDEFYFDAYDYAGRFVGSIDGDGGYDDDNGWDRVVYEVHDPDGYLEGAVLIVSDSNGGWRAKMFMNDSPTTYSTWGFDSMEEALDAFHRHRPTLELEEI